MMLFPEETAACVVQFLLSLPGDVNPFNAEASTAHAQAAYPTAQN